MNSNFVFALHDFDAENPDELSFKAGERIRIIERDEVFGDGWWQASLSISHFRLFGVPPHPHIHLIDDILSCIK
jgi:hypothetical protein